METNKYNPEQSHGSADMSAQTAFPIFVLRRLSWLIFLLLILVILAIFILNKGWEAWGPNSWIQMDRSAELQKPSYLARIQSEDLSESELRDYYDDYAELRIEQHVHDNSLQIGVSSHFNPANSFHLTRINIHIAECRIFLNDQPLNRGQTMSSDWDGGNRSKMSWHISWKELVTQFDAKFKFIGTVELRSEDPIHKAALTKIDNAFSFEFERTITVPSEVLWRFSSAPESSQ